MGPSDLGQGAFKNCEQKRLVTVNWLKKLPVARFCRHSLSLKQQTGLIKPVGDLLSNCQNEQLF